MRQKNAEMSNCGKVYDGSDSLYDRSEYWGRVRHSYKLYGPWNLMYSNKELIAMNSELKDYKQHLLTKKYTSEQLWDMKYAVMSNLHPETEQPVTAFFRWSAIGLRNIPPIFFLSILPPTTGNQIFGQAINQTLNFGTNICNSSATNILDIKQTAIAYTLSVTSAIAGSVGLRALLTKLRLPGLLGRSLIACTPYLGLVTASTVNLFFSRSRDLTEGIFVIDPKTGEKSETVKSKACGALAFRDGVALRWLVPISIFVFPPILVRFFDKRLKIYKRRVPRLLIDALIAYTTISGSLVVAMAVFNPMGSIRYQRLEEGVKEALGGEFDDDQLIYFYKGI